MCLYWEDKRFLVAPYEKCLKDNINDTLHTLQFSSRKFNPLRDGLMRIKPSILWSHGGRWLFLGHLEFEYIQKIIPG